MQALVRNALADPYVLGVSSGASLGAVLVMGYGSAIVGLSASGGAFAGALLSLVTVFVLAQRSGRLADTRLILAGVAISYLAMAGGVGFVGLMVPHAARALAQEAPLVVLDEPTNHLDVRAQLDLVELVHGLSAGRASPRRR